MEIHSFMSLHWESRTRLEKEEKRMMMMLMMMKHLKREEVEEESRRILPADKSRGRSHLQS